MTIPTRLDVVRETPVFALDRLLGGLAMGPRVEAEAATTAVERGGALPAEARRCEHEGSPGARTPLHGEA